MQELLTIFTGAMPIGEIRAALPLALAVFHFAPLKAYLLALLGNLLPVLPLLLFLQHASSWLMNHSTRFHRFFTWLFSYTRERHRAHFEKYNNWGALALFVFVAVPVPLTGVWSGCLAAFLFGIPLKRSFPAIALGAAVAGLIVLLVALGLIGGLGFLIGK